jgi:hypothetical protein
VNAFGIDEGVVLPRFVSEGMEIAGVPLCLESRNPVALAAKMKPYIVAVDLLLGRNQRTRRYNVCCKKLKSVATH